MYMQACSSLRSIHPCKITGKLLWPLELQVARNASDMWPQVATNAYPMQWVRNSQVLAPVLQSLIQFKHNPLYDFDPCHLATSHTVHEDSSRNNSSQRLFSKGNREKPILFEVGKILFVWMLPESGFEKLVPGNGPSPNLIVWPLVLILGIAF